MNKYNSPNWVCPVCKSVVTLTEKDEAPHYCYKCPSCGAITGADEWTEAACAHCRHYHPVDENNGECPLHGFVGDFCVACADFRSEEDCERLNAEWIEHRGAYRLYYPSRPEDSVAYVDDLSEVDKNNYDVVLCDMNATVKGHACNGKEFEDTLTFKMIPPKEDEKYYGTGYYMVVEQRNDEYPPQKHYVDVRYERTTDVEILADRWIKNFYGKNAEDIRKEFP